MAYRLPENLGQLNLHGSGLHQRAIALIGEDERMQSHISLVSLVVTVAERLCQLSAPGPDLTFVQSIAVRSLDALRLSLGLALGGHSRDSARIMCDLLERAFLLDLFAGDRSWIERYRSAESAEDRTPLSSIELQSLLDERDSSQGARKKLHDHYSGLAGQGATSSASTGFGQMTFVPQIDRRSLGETLFELARVADQIGSQLDRQFPPGEMHGSDIRFAFKKATLDRTQKFHSIWLPPFMPKLQ